MSASFVALSAGVTVAAFVMWGRRALLAAIALLLVVGLGLAFLDRHRAGRAMPDACTQAVTEQVADQPGLAVNHLQSPFRAVRNAEPAPGALIVVDLDDFSFHSG